MITFDTEAEFEAAVMRVIRERLIIDLETYRGCFGERDYHTILLQLDGETISSVGLD